jgi:hypothetical protein
MGQGADQAIEGQLPGQVASVHFGRVDGSQVTVHSFWFGIQKVLLQWTVNSEP